MQTIDSQALLSLYQQQEFDQLSEQLLHIIYTLQDPVTPPITSQQQQWYNDFVSVLFELFSKEDYLISEKYFPLFITKAGLISNVVAITQHKTTDAILAILSQQENNYCKTLTLYSHRNTIDINIKLLFEMHSYYASCWWTSLLSVAKRTQITQQAHQKLKKILVPEILEQHFKPPFKPDGTFYSQDFFNACNYIDPIFDLDIRKAINTAIQELNIYRGIEPQNPDFNKIAVVSRNFHRGHATYKAIAPMFYSLKDTYHLTCAYIHKTPASQTDHDSELFDETFFLTENTQLQLPSAEAIQSLVAQNFGVIIFADIGQEIVSTILANQRLAPIQLSCYGNPVSSQSTCVDYFIGSTQIEPVNNPEKNYSERLVLIPDHAVMAVVPDYTLRRPKKEEDVITVCCSWGNGKTNYPHLANLQKILQQSKKRIKFLFMGLDHGQSIEAVFEQELQSTISPVSILTEYVKPYDQYMADIERADIAIDCFPFGSYNRIVDNLYCGKPTIVMEGNRAFNRLAQALLHLLGLEELIAKTNDEFVQKTLRLIEDDAYRNALTERIEAMDLKTILAQNNSPYYFKKAIDFLITNHEQLQAEDSSTPIIIEEENLETKVATN